MASKVEWLREHCSSLPSMFILLALSVVYVRFGSLPGIAALFNGLKPAVIALLIVALQRVARTALRGAV
jgi:chromate transporter